MTSVFYLVNQTVKDYRKIKSSPYSCMYSNMFLKDIYITGNTLEEIALVGDYMYLPWIEKIENKN